ncbi:MAG: glycosyltransferase [Verrucomicrobia bacterium]|nr:glycosyltransferase [Verrucomicrobiota bacterium]MCH8514418.1 glycosyltransferase [Kiritimatiellia bacterium]
MDHLPKVTFAVLSWNRLQYLKATLESAFACIDYPNMEWVVSDNDSVEPGLTEYLQAHEGLDRVLRKKQSHAAAMNELVEIASGEYIFIWPEDVQFVVKGDWLRDVVEVLEANPDIGSVGLDGQRKVTNQRLFSPSPRARAEWALRDLKCFRRVRNSRRVTSSRGFALRTLGGAMPGVCGSGIPTLTRTSLWKELGGWRTREGSGDLVDSSLGAEDLMVETFYRSGRPLQMAHLEIPVAADIVTDPLGCKAKVRGSYRFGDYMPPPEEPFYYRIREQQEVAALSGERPLSFSDVADPLGFILPTDGNGDRLKAALNTSVVVEVATNQRVEHPLVDPEVASLL